MDVIDLRKNLFYLQQYVESRNRYVDLLLSNAVTVDETRKWLDRERVEVRCLVEGEKLLGSAILYLAKDGEVAFFVEVPGAGVGTRLLHVIQEVASERKLDCVWAWVLVTNERAKRAFVKAGYIFDGFTERVYGNEVRMGCIFRKKIKKNVV
jgi:hypothetical protein